MIKRNRTIRITKIALAGITTLSFLMHFITYTFSASVYLVCLVALIMLFVICKPVTRINDNLCLLTIASLICIILSYCRSTRLIGSTMDVLVLVSCMFLVWFPSKKTSDYITVLRVIKFFSFVYALGVMFQAFLPSIYHLLVSSFPSAFRSAVQNGLNTKTMAYHGFTTNVGFAASFISIGCLVVVSQVFMSQKIPARKMLTLVAMLIALMLTGKRASFVFLILTVVIVYLMKENGLAKIKRYWKLFCLLLAVIILFLAFRSYLIQIPFVRRIVETVEGLLAGEDVSSSRSKLSAWAWVLFLQNPLLGIGWGDYRTTVVGNATLVAELDTHNIYMQLLCETGIVGAICIIGMFIAFFLTTHREYKQTLQDESELCRHWRPLILFSLLFQTFFLLYGFTGNPLYDQNYQIIYMISCSIVIAYRHSTKNQSHVTERSLC